MHSLMACASGTRLVVTGPVEPAPLNALSRIFCRRITTSLRSVYLISAGQISRPSYFSLLATIS
jgi:hypothetical protein